MLLKEWIGQPGNQRRNKKIYGSKWRWKHVGLKLLWCSKSGSKREVCSNTGLPQEARKISNKQPNLTYKGARKRITNEA